MNRESVYFSVVSPAYKCAGCIDELYRRLVATLEETSEKFEIIFIDDGSPGDDWEVISKICNQDSRVCGVKLSRNYGQHYAISAGLDHAQGEWVVVMDCDLQDQPEFIPELYAKAREGYDIVFAHRANRTDSFFRRWGSNAFTFLYNWLSGMDFDNRAANFSISSRQVIDNVRGLRERNRSFPMLLHTVGFSHTSIEVEHSARYSGKSSYTFFKLFDFAVQTAISNSNKPLILSIRFGFLLTIVSIIYGCFIVARYFFQDISVEGWASIVVLISFLGGLGFANLGVLGLYLGKVFDEVKCRPLYVVETRINWGEHDAGKDVSKV